MHVYVCMYIYIYIHKDNNVTYYYGHYDYQYYHDYYCYYSASQEPMKSEPPTRPSHDASEKRRPNRVEPEN